ncbi:MAG: A/G-specific adenine glycosylase [Clostridia bacterium]|nr:A/G-specific adenine glycosylase [Clostridia bacterium]
MQNLFHLPSLLLPWFQKNARVLPWRADTEPYHVWISEIMLQQTRVEAVTDYYRRFLAALPDIASLAAVPDDSLMKLWQGLGYYSRARNLKKASQTIVDRFGGKFPDRYEDILSLPGIGDYTAGAISSICFERPVPAVDGNVLRVFARYTAWDRAIDGDGAKKYVTEQLRPLYVPGSCGAFTQSLMELGACVCLPNGAPDCGSCPLANECLANARGRATDYPVRSAKKARRIENRTVAVLRCDDRFAISKRPEKGLLAGLWEFPCVSTDLSADPEKAVLGYADKLGASPTGVAGKISYTHVFTHVEWHITGVFIDCAETPDALVWATREQLRDIYALPSAFREIMKALT